MKRSDFLRNALISLAVSLLPEILRPMKVNADGCIPLIAGDEIPTSPILNPESFFLIEYPWGKYWSHGSLLNNADWITNNDALKNLK